MKTVSPIVLKNDESAETATLEIKTPGAKMALATSVYMAVEGGKAPSVQLATIPQKIDVWFECIQGDYKGSKIHLTSKLIHEGEDSKVKILIENEEGEALDDIVAVELQANGQDDKVVGAALTIREVEELREKARKQAEGGDSGEETPGQASEEESTEAS